MYQQYLNQAVRTLQNLSSDELKDLLNDDDKLEERVNQAVEALELEKDVLLGQNRSLADSNLEREPKLIELRSRVNDLSEKGETIANSVKSKSSDLMSQSKNTNPETVLALLQTAAAECEEESERIVKQLLDNDITIDAYLEQFMNSRKTMHSRKLKAEKMTELLRSKTNQYRPGAVTGSHASPYPSQVSGFYPPIHQPATGAVPYPIGPISMPMPGMFGPPY
ncbi:vacuolar protein sorting-associated protein 37C [Toxorhynchites rutilus septentrionalis]|uniref:vacuolar protein sorting-associated protein 37C n=1 Tax=Toxorhynchites rutilus septentrionalis TaxID=329112 RepID=UPI002479F2A1|nr:vacuolar protein sorting-associated protein 37C [Toxorhynchites rutilus septentrionalis]